jgi:hypothetical protein
MVFHDRQVLLVSIRDSGLDLLSVLFDERREVLMKSPNDALHLFRGIPNRQSAASRSQSAAGRRITDVNQKRFRHTLEAQPTKICLKREAIEWLCHDSFHSHK